MAEYKTDSRFLSFLFLFVLVDLLFLPKLSYPVYIPLSVFVCFIFFLSNKFSRVNIIIFTIMFLSFFLSVISGVFLNKEWSVISDNSKRALQFFSFFLYGSLAYSYRLSKKDKTAILHVLRFAFVAFIILAILFVNNPSGVMHTIGVLYPESTFIHKENIENLRFSYILTDPNSAGYFFVMCLVVYLNLESKDLLKFIFIAIVSILVLFTQSRGAIVSLLGVYVWIVFFERKLLPKNLLIYSLPAIPLAILLFYNLGGFADVVTMLENRSQYESSLGGGRIDKYIYFINNFNFLPFGDGYNLTVDDAIFRPHSDLIRLNFSYGLLVTILFFYFVWPRNKSHLALLIPFSLGFLLNSIIDEYRLFGLFLFFQGILYNLYRSNEMPLYYSKVD